MSKDDIAITAFVPVFQEKVDRMKKRLKNELEKSKSERKKTLIKSLIKDIKQIQKTIKSATQDSGNRCPHCGEKI